MAENADRRALIAILAVFVLLQIPFLGGAFRVDDPNILAIAKQVAHAPLDPYGFTFNWTGTSRPAFDILANPPLAPFCIAAWAAVFGWSEISLHVLTLLFALIAIAAFFRITRNVVATALLAASPAFFISTQTVMPDMLMLALLTTSVAAAIRGRYAMAFIAGALTPVAKYNGVIAVAVLATIAISGGQAILPVSKAILPAGQAGLPVLHRRKLAVVAAAPIVGLASWSAYSLWQYGAIHLFIVSEERRSNLTYTLRDLAIEGKRLAAIDPFISVLVLTGLAVIPFGWRFSSHSARSRIRSRRRFSSASASPPASASSLSSSARAIRWRSSGSSRCSHFKRRRLPSRRAICCRSSPPLC
jgi:4-amino-4-deoxy-L-arabinose transferase-like glycosyltransferase